jgi:hypothetical protein
VPPIHVLIVIVQLVASQGKFGCLPRGTGAASGLLLVVDAIDEKEAPREAHNRECFSTPSRGQLR